MYFNTRHFMLLPAVLTGLLVAQQAVAAIALDRTRVIFPGGEHAISLKIRNENKQLPFLAQAWLEDSEGKKITSPLVILPPLQRVEPGTSSQLEVRAMPAAAQLPQDRESLFYFNLREIPPRSKNPNTLQLALQTRVKFFYRPSGLQQAHNGTAKPWQEKLTLTRQGQSYQVNNPTPFYISLVSASSHGNSNKANGFTPLMVAPESSAKLGGGVAALGDAPTLTYINDYGGSIALNFRCTGNQCQVNGISQ